MDLWPNINIHPGQCVRPCGTVPEVWEVEAVNYQRGEIIIVRDHRFQKKVSFKNVAKELVRLEVINGQVKEIPIEGESEPIASAQRAEAIGFSSSEESIHSNGYVAFRRVKEDPNQARPKDCHLLTIACAILWGKVF